jgi:Zn-dependent oligopeptidase
MYAFDVFKQIEPRGLLNNEVGALFVDCILRPGGSKHPLKLLEAFLGRSVLSQAYFDTLTHILKE